MLFLTSFHIMIVCLIIAVKGCGDLRGVVVVGVVVV